MANDPYWGKGGERRSTYLLSLSEKGGKEEIPVASAVQRRGIGKPKKTEGKRSVFFLNALGRGKWGKKGEGRKTLCG